MERRQCKCGCPLTFDVMPSSPQQYASLDHAPAEERNAIIKSMFGRRRNIPKSRWTPGYMDDNPDDQGQAPPDDTEEIPLDDGPEISTDEVTTPEAIEAAETVAQTEIPKLKAEDGALVVSVLAEPEAEEQPEREKNSMTENGMMSVPEAAKKAGLKLNKIHAWIFAGKIKGTGKGRGRLVSLSEVQALAAGKRAAPVKSIFPPKEKPAKTKAAEPAPAPTVDPASAKRSPWWIMVPVSAVENKGEVIASIVEESKKMRLLKRFKSEAMCLRVALRLAGYSLD
jgi:hypothetical protein